MMNLISVSHSFNVERKDTKNISFHQIFRADNRSFFLWFLHVSCLKEKNQ